MATNDGGLSLSQQRQRAAFWFIAPMLAALTLPYSVWNCAALSPTYCSIARRSFRSSSARPLTKVVFIGDCASWQGSLGGELVQDLRQVGVHPRALTCGQDDH